MGQRSRETVEMLSMTYSKEGASLKILIARQIIHSFRF